MVLINKSMGDLDNSLIKFKNIITKSSRNGSSFHFGYIGFTWIFIININYHPSVAAIVLTPVSFLIS